MHVVHVLEASLGGTRRYLESIIIASRLSPRQTSFIYSFRRADGAFARTLALAREAGWEMHRLDMRREVGAHDFADAFNMRKLLRHLRPDCVHAHSSKAGALVRLALAPDRNRPRVLYSPHAVAQSKSYLAIERALAKLVPTTFVAVSDSEQRQLASLGFAPANEIPVVYPTVEQKYFEPREQIEARKRLGIPLDVPVVLGVGRMVEQKNPIDFLRCVSRLRREFPNLRAIWIGDGKLERRFEAEITTLGLGNVVGRKPWADDIRDDYAACDVALSTAKFESFGFVVAEAMSMERLAIASNAVGTRDVLAGCWKDLAYTPGDLDKAAATVANALRQTPNYERSKAARISIAERFSSARLTASLEALYGEEIPATYAAPTIDFPEELTTHDRATRFG